MELLALKSQLKRSLLLTHSVPEVEKEGFSQALVGGSDPQEPVVLAQRLEESKVLQKTGREGCQLRPTPLAGGMGREEAEEGEAEAEGR